jgi:GNAT superfamily N-acetyltransferase
MPVQTNFIEERWNHIMFTLDDAYGVMAQFALTLADVVNLCGGIPLPEITGIHAHIFSQYAGALTARISTDQYEVIRMIDLDIRRIDNRVMVVAPEARGQGIGTNLFLNQVQAARQLHFAKLQTYTRAPSLYDEEDQDWQGYYFWANFGFVNDEEEEFKKWAIARNRPENTLNELMQTEEGRNLWKHEGFGWIGKFGLGDGDISFTLLIAYLKRKGIDWP